MVKVLIWLLLVFCTLYLCLGIRRNKYQIIHDKIIIESYNRSVVRNPSVTVRDFNSTCKHGVLRAFGDFIIGIKKNVLISTSVYKLVGTIYRSIPIPIAGSIDLCSDVIQKSKEFAVVISYSNFRGCPVPPGNLSLRDYVLEEEKFPPHIPLGKYKLYLEVYFDDTNFLGNGTWNGAVVKKL